MNTIRSLKLRTDCTVSLFSITKPYPMPSRKGKSFRDNPITSDGVFPPTFSKSESFKEVFNFTVRTINKTNNRLAEIDYNDKVSLWTKNFPSLYNFVRL